MTTDDDWDIAQAKLEGRCPECGDMLPRHDESCSKHLNHRAQAALEKARLNMQEIQSIIEYAIEHQPEVVEEFIKKTNYKNV